MEEEEILRIIEKLRRRMYMLIRENGGIDEEIIEASRKLDRFLNVYNDLKN